MTKGERIAFLRKGKGMTMVELADRIGVLKQTMYKYENDITTNIPSDKIELMADALGTSPAYIMGWDDEEAPFGDDIERSEKAARIDQLYSLLTQEQQALVENLIQNLLSARKG